MFIFLKSNVFFVRGAVKGCLYDFNTRNLYHLEADVVRMISNVLGKRYDELQELEEKELVKEFIENDLMILSNIMITNDIKKLITEKDSVDFAWIEVTTKCNLYCIHCYDSASPHEISVMSEKDFEKVHKFIKDCSIKRVQFIGGEPLLVGETLKTMIRLIRKDVDFLEVFTNATLLTDSWASFFSEYNVHVAVSVYSYIDIEHDKVTTVKGSHEKTNRGIEKLAYYRVPYRVCNVLMKGVEIGSQNTDLYTINSKKDIVRMSGRANFGLLSKELLKKRIITENTFSVPLNPKLSSRLLQGHNCFGHKVYISATGEVFPCVMERRWTYGNLIYAYEDTIHKVVDGYIAVRKEDINSCKRCEFRYTCFDCRPNSLEENLKVKPWYCSYLPEEGRWENLDSFIAVLIQQNTL